jgi:Glycosyltransferases, probably involved in cell wall biogenesis
MLKIKKAVKILLTEGVGVFLRKVWKKRCSYLDLQRAKKEMRSIHVITRKQRNWQRQYVFKKNIKFSIITPLYNTPKRYLNELIESLEKQTYSNWELCLADGSDADHSYVRKICHRWCRKDGRIVYKKLKENRGISHNTNACIKISSGQYLGLLDHDDVLHESALFEMMLQISKSDADFLYSDEAKFSGKVEDAVDFNFKPGFGKDELRSHNYICHFTVFSRELLKKIGKGFRSEFDGSQDHDMVLRLTEKAEKITHISKVLYYWRVHPESVSMNLDAKNYAVDAAIRAVQEQLDRTGESGTVESSLPYQTIYRNRYQILRRDHKIAILIYGMDNMQEYDDFVVQIQDITACNNLSFIPIIEEDKKSFGEMLNHAVSQSDAEYIVVLNIACIPLGAEWIEEMLMFAQRKDVAAVSPKILFENRTIAYAGIALDNDKEDKIRYLCQGIPDTEQGYEAILRYVRNTTSVCRECFMIERSKLECLRGFREDLRGYEEIDLSLRAIEQGYWNVWTCFAAMQLTENNLANNRRDIAGFVKLWNNELRHGDIFYHSCWKKIGLV